MKELNDMGLVAEALKDGYSVHWDKKTNIIDIKIPDSIDNVPITTIGIFSKSKIKSIIMPKKDNKYRK